MTPTEKLMKRCQIGFGGPYGLAKAHDCLADCYGRLRKLKTERDRLLTLATKHCPKDHHDWKEIQRMDLEA